MITYKHHNIRNVDDVESFEQLAGSGIDGPKVMVRTCQRLEIYHGNGPATEETVDHLFRLVCGLDSVFTGDTAIKGQVKKAYCGQAEKGELGSFMHKLFQAALRVGKLVQSTTGISTGAVTYPQAVIRFLQSRFPDFQHQRICIVGKNDITLKLIRWFVKSGVQQVNLVNRTYESIARLDVPEPLGRFPLESLPGLLTETDILVVCTSSPEYMVKKQDLQAGHSLCIIDLSCPRNVDPAVSCMQNIELFTLDEIERSIQQNLEKRKESISMAEEIIEQEVKNFMQWQIHRKSSPCPLQKGTSAPEEVFLPTAFSLQPTAFLPTAFSL